jgi:hypothetical protein
MLGEIQTRGWSPRSQRSVESDETARSERNTVKNLSSISIDLVAGAAGTQ